MNAIAFWQSGEPYTVTDGQNLINLPNITSDRPNQISGQSCQASNPSIHDWINYNAFQQQPIGNPGNEGRAQCYGPQWRGLDFSVFKDFTFAEKYKLSFRAEAYNITNTPNFALPNAAISSWTVSRSPAGIPTNAGSIRPDHGHQHRFYSARVAVGAEDDVLTLVDIARPVLRNAG